MPTASDVLEAVLNDEVARVGAILAESPELASSRDRDGVSALMHARYRSNRAMLDALLATDPDLDVHEAAALGYLDRLRGLVGDDPSLVGAVSGDGFTPLHFAAFFAKPEAARMLLDLDAPVDAAASNASRVQPLHSAAAGRAVEICRMLLAAGADVNARQADGFVPLHAAAQNGDPEIMELFLSAGADPAVATDDGRTAADLADAAMHPDVARRLREVVAGG
jgi:ankyrin repeat protein